MKIGSYQDIQFYKETGHSIIFLAKDRQGNKRALKVLSLRVAQEEFALTARLNHPRIVKVCEAGEIPLEDAPPIQQIKRISLPLGYFSMEYLEGKTLREKLVEAGEGLPAHIVLEQMFAIAQALLPRWKEGSFHLDIKPGNIIDIPQRGWVLIDFGAVAKYHLRAKKWRIFSRTLSPWTCTSYYVAPEVYTYIFFQPRPKPHCDFFSLGATIYHLLYNTPICGGIKYETDIDDFYCEKSEDDVFPERVDNPRLLEFFMRACAFERRRRVQDPDEFLGLLERAKEEAGAG